ncbi:flavohemoglobin expression-modulating QEGLA motif protein [Thaumasiovibrio subtropicus]|uniref:flavohemoglobin expression-modulating QEGLA motif protein n=1 Tax=Thaumasiovibrio subtropicus TaxID=1891207 RepID=UPI000B35BB67|nr:flavohemoglobin expression-modulating QEGLA motif protein [Thaumasiovibrio subtropicus]
MKTMFSTANMLSAIERGECFNGTSESGHFSLRINSYAPCIAVVEEASLSFSEHEDSASSLTEMVASLPIVFTLHGTKETRDGALATIAQAVWLKLKAQFQTIPVYVLSSTPHCDSEVANYHIGTQYLDKRRAKKSLSHLKTQLSAIKLPNLDTLVSASNVGALYEADDWLKSLESAVIFCLHLPCVYRDANTGTIFPIVKEAFEMGLRSVLSSHSAELVSPQAMRRKTSYNKLLSEGLPPGLIAVDLALFRLAKGVNTLSYINPINVKAEKRRFLAKPWCYSPVFKYRQLDLDPYAFREKLYRLPLERIEDPAIRALYRRTIDQLAVRIDLLSQIGTEDFLYNSLRYYGQPSEVDINNARFILHSHSEQSDDSLVMFDAKQAIDKFKTYCDFHHLKCQVAANDKLVAKALVGGERLKVNRRQQFSALDIRSLQAHELGVHMLTTLNAKQQPLRIFQLGLPGNTHTQEGLAILAEYLSDSCSIERLKVLALRVIAVNMMVNGHRFAETYQCLHEEHGASPDNAFTVTTRAYRGGGFTKDYLYLNGVKEAFQRYQTEDLASLFVGKTAFEYKPVIDELLQRQIVMPPHIAPWVLSPPEHEDPIVRFLLRSLK